MGAGFLCFSTAITSIGDKLSLTGDIIRSTGDKIPAIGDISAATGDIIKNGYSDIKTSYPNSLISRYFPFN